MTYEKHPQRGKATKEAIATIPEYECELRKVSGTRYFKDEEAKPATTYKPPTIIAGVEIPKSMLEQKPATDEEIDLYRAAVKTELHEFRELLRAHVQREVERAFLLRKKTSEKKGDSIFISHIEAHLKNMDIKTYGGKVICKICNKSVDEIYAEEGKRFEHATQQAVEKALEEYYVRIITALRDERNIKEKVKERLQKEKKEKGRHGAMITISPILEYIDALYFAESCARIARWPSKKEVK